MEFVEYAQMNNNPANFELDSSAGVGDWVVTEKIHGANFSFLTDGKEVRMARRKGILGEGENFFNYKTSEFSKTYPDKIKDVYNDVVKVAGDQEICQVTVYGELFGGIYHVDGKNIAKKNGKPVQSEVQYCPDIKWCAFDISYKTKAEPDKPVYLDADEATKIFKKNEILHVQPLFIGPMEEALAYKLGFDSTLPALFGLPPLPAGTNTAEGVVVKPLKNVTCMTKRKEETRLIIKLKVASFVEVTHTKHVKNKPEKQKPQNMLTKILNYTTEQRLVCAISKIGDPADPAIAEAVCKEFIADAFADIKDNDAELFQEWSNAPEKERTKIQGILHKKANGLIQKYNKSR